MSNNVNTEKQSGFFPNNKTHQPSHTSKAFIDRNDDKRVKELTVKTSKDAKVEIPDAVKDFARIKKAADLAPELNNSAKIEDLKSRIQGGTYQIDFDAVADRMLEEIM